MDDEPYIGLDLPPVKMTDAETAEELYRYLVLVLDTERAKQNWRVRHGPD